MNQMLNNGWNLVGVHAPGTGAEEIKKAIADSGIEYPVLLGAETQTVEFTPSNIAGFPVRMYPCCVLIGKDGNVQAVGTLQDVLTQYR